MYPNPALPAWEMGVMAIVPVTALAIWLIAVYLAARDTGPKQAAAGAQPESATAASDSRSPSAVSGRQPQRPRAGRTAA